MQWWTTQDGTDTVEEFWAWEQIQEALAGVNSQSIDSFRHDFANYIGVHSLQIRFTPSGRQGLEWLLRAHQPSRRGVLMPAFNCVAVQDAVAAAGCEPHLYDFGPRTGVFDWQQVIDLMSPTVGVLIITHYFGVPVDFGAVLEHCVANDITVIEDCAHTLGGTIGGRQAGTIGDAAIYSFNYDKPISLGWGGCVSVNNTARFDLRVPTEFREPEIEEELSLLRDFVAVMKQRRREIPRSNALLIRLLRRARVLSTKGFRKSRTISLGALQAEVGRWCLTNYASVVRARNRNAKWLADAVKQTSWPVGGGVAPAWIKQKIYVSDQAALCLLTTGLQRNGLRVGNFNWPYTLTGKGGLTAFRSQQAATNWVDVPVHQNLQLHHLQQIATAFADLTCGGLA